MAACMAFIMPKVAQGGACTQGFECTTGNCEGASTDPVVDGMCVAAPVLAARGVLLVRPSSCVDDAYCDSANICQPVKGAGEACTSDNECVNTCNTTTNTCSCYSGCAIAGYDHDARHVAVAAARRRRPRVRPPPPPPALALDSRSARHP